MARGWRILAERVRRSHAKIDLVAKRRRLLAFVEVKACATLDHAAFAATPRQEAHIIDAARARLVAHPAHADFKLPFAVILTMPRPLPHDLLAAFDASLRTPTPGLLR
jgi:putative endonuclease